jgi:hypothetical protein
MARPEVTSRKHASRNRTSPLVERAGKSIAEFCAAYGISRATFANWRKDGVAPACTQVVPRGRVLITQESEDQWKRAHTAIANAITAAE